ncbi:hypothetical protein GCM10023331_23890 [Algivirga pacifica]|uniref:Uncharacterized protein n=1 Tax=Algivirga pacifica TaxID=1162670 RepID=A0ABP9DF91_9BACT
MTSAVYDISSSTRLIYKDIQGQKPYKNSQRKIDRHLFWLLNEFYIKKLRKPLFRHVPGLG